MAFISTAMTIFAVTSRLVALATATPVPSGQAGGIAIPLTRHSSFLSSNGSIDLDAITSHGISVREKILSGLDNYEMNMGTMHPLAVKRSESGLGKRQGGRLPLTSHQNEIWVGQISIGTPPRTLTVQITTGSADMWILENNCAGITPDHLLWDPISSETVEYSGQSFELRYGDGTVIRGDQYIDNVTIAGFTANPQTFGVATSYDSPIQNNGYPDGHLGLAFPSISNFGTDPLFTSLIKQRSLRMTNRIFSLKLSSSGAEMYVGGSNRMLYNGQIFYTHVTVPGFWQVSMNSIRLNGNKKLVNIPAILDTGSNFIFGDRERVRSLYEPVGGIVKPVGSIDYYTLPCRSFPTVSITFSGKTFRIPPEAFNVGQLAEDPTRCYGAILGHQQSAEYWIIGTPFLRNVYTVFDPMNSRVGFADLS